MSSKSGGKKRPSPGTVNAHVERNAREGALYRLTNPPPKYPHPKPRRRRV